MVEFIYQWLLGIKWYWGGFFYYVCDCFNGQGGLFILGQGFNSIFLFYNGIYCFFFGSRWYWVDVAWLGIYFDYNLSQMVDIWFLLGYVNYNFGCI